MKTKTPTVKSTLAWLKAHAKPENAAGMARYGIVAEKVLGVTVADLHVLAKEIGRNHSLAMELWETGIYEARMLTAFIDDPAEVTPAQMDRQVKDFDNWAVCDTLCFHLYDRTPHAFAKVKRWAKRKPEFERRAAFALLAGLAGHDKKSGDLPFLATLPLIEAAASDERNFVKKAVSWALRSLGQRSFALHDASVALAGRLAASEDKAERWVGKDALKDLSRPLVKKKLEKRGR